MRAGKHLATFAVLALVLLAAAIHALYRADLAAPRRKLLLGSTVATTDCGPIEYSDAGSGPAVLAVHGAGGGYFQMKAVGRSLVAAGFRVVSVSRFGYLRTPLPAEATPAAQAAAHACLLDTLGIPRAAAIGVSAGAPSSMQFCLRYPDRCSALVLLVPAAFAPGTSAEETTPPSPYMRFVLDHVLESDFLMWAVTRVAPKVLIETALATPYDVFLDAGVDERARAMGVIRDIFPVSPKLEGLRNDARIAAGLSPEHLGSIEAPTLAISTEDDLYRTLAGARYAAGHIPGARLVVFPTGGHAWLGHDDEVMNEIVSFLESVFRTAEPAIRP